IPGFETRDDETAVRDGGPRRNPVGQALPIGIPGQRVDNLVRSALQRRSELASDRGDEPVARTLGAWPLSFTDLEDPISPRSGCRGRMRRQEAHWSPSRICPV